MQPTLQPSSPSQQYWSDRRWIHDNCAALVADHANEWIAVHQGRLLASGTDLGAVEDAARAIAKDAEIVLQFIDDGSLIY